MAHDDERDFDSIVRHAISERERDQMEAAAARIAGLHKLQERVQALYGRAILWADEHPEALSTLADPSIRLTGDDAWSLPAGWVPLVNELHATLVAVMGDYQLEQASQKSGGLRYLTVPVARGEAADLITAARGVSYRTCELCGKPGGRAAGQFSTRCDRHPSARPDRVPGAVARPPGWRLPPEAALQ